MTEYRKPCGDCARRKTLPAWARLGLYNAALARDGKPLLADEAAMLAMEHALRVDMAQRALAQVQAAGEGDDDGTVSGWCLSCCPAALAMGGPSFCEVVCNYLGAGCECCDDGEGGGPPRV